MSGGHWSATLADPPPSAALVLLAGIGATVVLLVLAAIFPIGAARAWLIGLLFWLGLPTGALFLELTRRITGGGWGEATAAALLPTLRALPLFLLLVVPLLLTLSLVYPWAAASGLVAADVAWIYLSFWPFALRTVAILLIWSLIARLLIGGTFENRPALAGLALLIVGVTFSFAATDWFLTLDPVFRSTAFPMFLASVDIMMALAWTAWLLPPPARPHQVDVARLMTAAAVAIFYLAFIQYLVIWAGNLPHEAGWYVSRNRPAWIALLLGALALAVLLPAVTLVRHKVRESSRAISRIGAGVLVGLCLGHLWLVLPSFGAIDAGLVIATALALIAVGGLWAGLAHGGLRLLLRMRIGRRSHGG